jgi:hypothetical protein
MTHAPRTPSALLGVGGLGVAALVVGCVETRHPLGEDCLKADDCLSGVCSQLHCAATPPTTDVRAVGDAGQTTELDAASADEQATAD